MIKLAKLNNHPEIFHTIQGEGKNLGKPSVFVRLSLCNLYCKWCDTDYTWNWKDTQYAHNYDTLPGYEKYDKKAYIAELPDAEILQRIRQFNCTNVVVTGGEPLVQQKALRSLFRAIKEAEPAFHIEFETNGTIRPLREIDALTDQYNVSVKLANSGVNERDRIIPSALAFFSASPKANFKFVVNEPADLEEVLALIRDYSINRNAVFLMPQGVSASALKEKQQWLVEICKAYNLNYTERLHIHIWGNKRGV